ncbi:hypothetical protein B0H13DRAFT_1922528 [Mycena leptocephala]|nr:hypothetical protein B0H13DRAFT_1922528 [Mycena leptocephala]
MSWESGRMISGGGDRTRTFTRPPGKAQSQRVISPPIMNPNDMPTFPTRHFFDGHVRKDNAIFGVHCGDPTFILNLPARKDAPIHHPGQKRAEFQRTTWIYPATPYLLFVPRDSAFHEPLFARLRVPRTGLPIFQDEDNGRWMLSPTLADQWAQLENGLRRVLAAIHQLHPGGINEGFIPLRVPSHYGYAGTRPTHASALYFAMEARNAFLPLMGNLTMMMVASDYRGVPNWRQKVIDISQVHSQWFADLEASAVGDLHIPRVGGILDFTCDYEDASFQRRHPHSATSASSRQNSSDAHPRFSLPLAQNTRSSLVHTPNCSGPVHSACAILAYLGHSSIPDWTSTPPSCTQHILILTVASMHDLDA